jgi:hypothetical protein
MFPKSLTQPGLGAFPKALTQPGLGGLFDDVIGGASWTQQNTDTYLVRKMHTIAQAIYDAKQANDKVKASVLLEQFQAVANQYRANGGTELTAVDNFVLAVGNWIESSIDAIPAAIAALPKAIGFGLLQAAVPFAILFGGYVLLRNWGRK